MPSEAGQTSPRRCSGDTISPTAAARTTAPSPLPAAARCCQACPSAAHNRLIIAASEEALNSHEFAFSFPDDGFPFLTAIPGSRPQATFIVATLHAMRPWPTKACDCAAAHAAGAGQGRGRRRSSLAPQLAGGARPTVLRCGELIAVLRSCPGLEARPGLFPERGSTEEVGSGGEGWVSACVLGSAVLPA